MAPIDRRLRVWAWMVRRQTAALTRSEADVIALQSRRAPANAVTNYVFGTVAPGTEVSDRVIAGPGGDLPVRLYQPRGAGTVPRPLIVYLHGGGFVFGDLPLSDSPVCAAWPRRPWPRYAPSRRPPWPRPRPPRCRPRRCWPQRAARSPECPRARRRRTGPPPDRRRPSPPAPTTDSCDQESVLSRMR
ncbi:MAG: alpha/beta hydrolase [Streptosporangiaceae bacterium]